VTVSFAGRSALRNINLEAKPNEILSIIGPANSGKTTLLRAINRMNDLVPNMSVQGRIYLDGQEITRPGVDLSALRRRVGMVFAIPVPLPQTVYENLTFGPRLHGIHDRPELEKRVQESLQATHLWDEVKDRLHTSGLKLSGGQQQRLCLARTLALEPEVILLDEPCSGLDPISTGKIEDTMRELKSRITIIWVTSNVKQSARVADRVAFFLMGELVEAGPAEEIFTAPRDRRTDDYISGRFG
jgi:phosphate transport system ATP-binding protein